MNYWSNRRICSSIGELPLAIKRKHFYELTISLLAKQKEYLGLTK